MTVTDQQLRAIAYLAKACRPNGARRWDEAGIAANLEKVRDRDLAEVIIATIQAAVDRDADTPGVIPAAGSHWQQAAAVHIRTIETLTPGTRCSVCSLSETSCRMRWAGDHAFRSVAAADKDAAGTDAAAAAAVARAGLQSTKVFPEPPTIDELTARDPVLAARLEHLRATVPGVRAGELREAVDAS